MTESRPFRFGSKGTRDPRYKLSAEQRAEVIRRLNEEDEDPKTLALEFGVTAAAIRRYRS